MPDDYRIDPFKPQQPSIPGLAPSTVKAKLSPPAPAVYSTSIPEEKAPPSPMLWVALSVLGTLVVLCFGFFYWMKSSRAKAMGEVSLAEASAAMDVPAPTKGVGNLPAGPGPIATTDELSRAWSSKHFQFRDALTSQMSPAMVVHLPGGQYWGFSLREPFGNCELVLMTDLKTLKSGYNLKADHPMVVDPCSRTVYDLLRYGGGTSDNGLVRGEIVQGSGIRPPMAIEILVRGKDVIATRME